MSNWSESEITLGRVEGEFEALYGDKGEMARLSMEASSRELSRICARENIGLDAFHYLERKLILDREVKA